MASLLTPEIVAAIQRAADAAKPQFEDIGAAFRKVADVLERDTHRLRRPVNRPLLSNGRKSR